MGSESCQAGEHKEELIDWCGLTHTFPTHIFYLSVPEFCPFIINQ